MRVFPAPLGMMLLLGQRQPTERDRSMRERIHDGHQLLVRVAGTDLGFEPSVWHRYLRSQRGTHYRWTDAGFERRLSEARSNPDWVSGIQELTHNATANA